MVTTTASIDSPQQTPHRTTFGELVQRRRLQLGLTQRELAQSTYYSNDSISKIEQGKRFPDTSGMQRIADTLHLTEADRDQLIAALAAIKHPGVGLTGSPHPAAFPHPLTPIIGREDDLALLIALIAQEQARCVSLKGVVGVGKTRLAIELGQRLREAFDFVVFVEITGAPTGCALEELIAEALGLSPQRGFSAMETLIAAIKTSRVLLVLDDLDLDRAQHVSIGQLLARCPTLYVVVTSRSAPNIADSHIFTVQPFLIDDDYTHLTMEDATRFPAVQIFLAALRRYDAQIAINNRDGGVIAAICQRLEGIPLALESAAFWLQTMTPLEVLIEIETLIHEPIDQNGGTSLQHFLNTTLESSYAQLDQTSKRVLHLIALFPTEADMQGITAIGKAIGLTRPMITGALPALLQSHLVVRVIDAEGNYFWRVRPGVKAFLAPSMDETTEVIPFKQAFVAYISTMYFDQRGNLKIAPNSLFRAKDITNLRSATLFARALEGIPNRQGTAFCFDAFFWDKPQLIESSLEMYSTATYQLAPTTDDLVEQGNALAHFGYGMTEAHYPLRKIIIDEALRRFEQSNARARMSFAYVVLARGAMDVGDFATAETISHAQRSNFQRLQDRMGIVDSEFNLAAIARMRGDLSLAAEQLQRLHQPYRSVPVYAAFIAEGLGSTFMELHAYEAAMDLLTPYVVSSNLCDRYDLNYLTYLLGQATQGAGRVEEARRLYRSSFSDRYSAYCQLGLLEVSRGDGALPPHRRYLQQAHEQLHIAAILYLAIQADEATGDATPILFQHAAETPILMRAYNAYRLQQREYHGSVDLYGDRRAKFLDGCAEERQIRWLLGHRHRTHNLVAFMRQALLLAECLEGMALISNPSLDDRISLGALTPLPPFFCLHAYGRLTVLADRIQSQDPIVQSIRRPITTPQDRYGAMGSQDFVYLMISP